MVCSKIQPEQMLSLIFVDAFLFVYMLLSYFEFSVDQELSIQSGTFIQAAYWIRPFGFGVRLGLIQSQSKDKIW